MDRVKIKLGASVGDLTMCCEGELSLNGLAMVSQKRGEERKKVAPLLKTEFWASSFKVWGRGEEGLQAQQGEQEA